MVHAQTSYEDAFCDHYDFSVECYEYWARAEGKIVAFVDVYTARVQKQDPAVALANLRTMQDQLATAIQYYQ